MARPVLPPRAVHYVESLIRFWEVKKEKGEKKISLRDARKSSPPPGNSAQNNRDLSFDI